MHIVCTRLDADGMTDTHLVYQPGTYGLGQSVGGITRRVLGWMGHMDGLVLRKHSSDVCTYMHVVGQWDT